MTDTSPGDGSLQTPGAGATGAASWCPRGETPPAPPPLPALQTLCRCVVFDRTVEGFPRQPRPDAPRGDAPVILPSVENAGRWKRRCTPSLGASPRPASARTAPSCGAAGAQQRPTQCAPAARRGAAPPRVPAPRPRPPQSVRPHARKRPKFQTLTTVSADCVWLSLCRKVQKSGVKSAKVGDLITSQRLRLLTPSPVGVGISTCEFQGDTDTQTPQAPYLPSPAFLLGLHPASSAGKSSTVPSWAAACPTATWGPISKAEGGRR